MARIRTIKPEALQHRKIGRLSIWARWLWLGMVTQADDEGRLVADPGQLRLLAFGYDDDMTMAKVSALLSEIETTGLIVLYEVKGVPYAAFPSWRDHQRIDRPKSSKLPSPPGLRSTTHRRRLAERSTSDVRMIDGDQGSRIKEGIKDQGGDQGPDQGTSAEPTVAGTATEVVRKKVPTTPGSGAFEAYAAAFQAHYGVPPVRNMKTNALFKRLAELLGSEAPEVASFFVGHRGQLYVRSKHDPQLLVRDAAGLRTEWLTGRMVTETGARQADQRAERGDVAARLLEKARRQEITDAEA